MRIFGGKDYYDSVMSYGVDPSVVFNRNKTEDYIQDILYRAKKDIHFDIITDVFYLEDKLRVDPQRGRGSFYFTAGSVLFCGNFFPFYARHQYGYKQLFNKVYYDADSLLVDYPEIKGYTSWMFEGSRNKPMYNWLKDEYFNKYSTEYVTKFMLDHKITTGVMLSLRKEWNQPGQSGIFVDVSRLEDFQFYTVKDPYTAYSEIHSWISGVLGSGVETVTLSNKSKIQKAGFDLVTSFRNMKRG